MVWIIVILVMICLLHLKKNLPANFTKTLSIIMS